MDDCSRLQSRPANPGGEGFIICKRPILRKNHRAYKATESIVRSKEQNKQTDSVPEEDSTLDLLAKDFNSTFLNVLNKPKETIDTELKEIRKTMYEQNENINIPSKEI